MTSELVAARLQPLLSDMRQMREIMATKADLAPFATKADLARFATKEDLARFATKEDLARFATKEDLAERDASIMKWVFGALMAQAALIVALIKLFP